MKRILLFCSIVLFTRCGVYNTFDCYDGESINKELSPGNFNGLDIDFPCELIHLEGNELSVHINAKSDLIEDLTRLSSISDEIWKLRIQKKCTLANRNDVKITVVVPDLRLLKIDGNAKVKTIAKVSNTNENLAVIIDGNANLDFNIDHLEKFSVSVDGNAEAILTGNCDDMEAIIDGNANLKAHGFNTKKCSLKIDGNADAEVNVSELLVLEVDGLGRVCYKGNPLLSTQISGVGTVKNCN